LGSTDPEAVLDNHDPTDPPLPEVSTLVAGVTYDPSKVLVVDPRVYIADADPAEIFTRMMANRWTAVLRSQGGVE
jgi:hypothetical protein